jgi:hypothetical protein
MVTLLDNDGRVRTGDVRNCLVGGMAVLDLLYCGNVGGLYFEIWNAPKSIDNMNLPRAISPFICIYTDI